MQVSLTLGGKMDLDKKYYDCDGKECNILQLVKNNPEWAANVIQEIQKGNRISFGTEEVVNELIENLFKGMGEETKKKFLPYKSTFRQEWREILVKRLLTDVRGQTN